jgi:hypothetical protein
MELPSVGPEPAGHQIAPKRAALETWERRLQAILSAEEGQATVIPIVARV